MPKTVAFRVLNIVFLLSSQVFMYCTESLSLLCESNVPLVNPYVRGNLVLPAMGKAYVDRTQSYMGMITETLDNSCYRAFVSRGYEWGGNAWPDRIDYQHFSKQISDIS